MFGYKRYVVGDSQRGLMIRDGHLVRVLTPGVYRVFDPMGRNFVSITDITDPQCHVVDAEVYLKASPDVANAHLELVSLADNEIGLLHFDGKLNRVLEPGSEMVFWKALVKVEVERINIDDDLLVPEKVRTRLARAGIKSDLGRSVANSLYAIEVKDQHVGLLLVDGELKSSLMPGLHVFWTYRHSVKVEHVDLRVQAMDVSGQEILTKDKVSLRVNLAASYQLTDPVTARKALSNATDHLYRELQFGLRQAISVRTLDTLLGEKDALDRVVFETVSVKLDGLGMKLISVGVKDVILPGDMKDILNKVVEAEKVAQANVIKRREETAATRSALNTAKLMDEHPTLMRLKELEALEKVTEKVDRLTVFGGLEGVLKDTVRLNVQ